MTTIKLFIVIAFFFVVPVQGRAEQFRLSDAVIGRIAEKYGPVAETRLRNWQQLIQQTDLNDDVAKLTAVNDFFNGASFVDDMTQWHQADYWATPLEFLIYDAGDCEDFSIAKYYTLKEMGIEVNKLRITYVRALSLNQAHMVLAYYREPDAEPLILDNINKRIRLASQRPDLKPVYSFNANDLWLNRQNDSQLRVGKPNQIGHWRDIMSRMEASLN